MDNNPQLNAIISLLVSLALLLVNPLSIYAQTDYVVQGQVVDAETQKPLPYVTLSIADGQISSTTNKDGNFLLKIPQHLKRDTLRITALNYLMDQQSLIELGGTNSIIRLNSALSQSQTSITNQYANPNPAFQVRDTLLKAIALIAKNYTNKPTLLHGFYREVIEKLQPRICVSYAEGVIDVYKPSYYFTKKNDQIHFVKGRRKPLTTFTVPVLTPGPWVSNMLDIVKYEEFLFRDGSLNKDYIFNLVGSTVIGDQSVYVISFNPISLQINGGYFAGRLFLTTSSLAIIRGEYGLTEQGLNIINKSSHAQVYSTKLEKRSYTVNYTKFGDRWSFHNGSVENTFTDQGLTSSFESRVDFVVTHRQSDNVKPFRPKEIAIYNRLSMQAFDTTNDDFFSEENYIMPIVPKPSLLKNNN